MVIYVSNLSEDVWPFISAISGTQEKEFEVQENANLAERDFFAFSGIDDLVMVMPKSSSEEFVNYYLDLFGNQNLKIFVPKVHTGEICEDLLDDHELFHDLLTLAKKENKITLLSYSTSPQFYKLARELRKQGVDVNTPEAPEEEDAWTVNFFGSKSGIRQIAQISSAVEPDFVMPNGLICSGINDASLIAANKYLEENGVVIKTNKGHSGAGVLIFRAGSLPAKYADCVQEIRKHLSKDGYWEKFPIVVETLINGSEPAFTRYPNVEFKINKNGTLDFLYACGQRITQQGVFKGVEIHDGVIPERLEARLIDTGYYLAERYSRFGYRGYFDIDFVATRSGKVYVTESNVRRTGGTHVYQTTEHLFGKDFMYDVYTLSDNNYLLPKGKKYTFTYLLDKLKPILFDRKRKEGLMLISEHLLTQGSLAYIIYGKNKKRAQEIEQQMEQLLRG